MMSTVVGDFSNGVNRGHTAGKVYTYDKVVTSRVSHKATKTLRKKFHNSTALLRALRVSV
jgi:hypothetical protein